VTIDLNAGKAYHGGYVDTLVSIESFRGSYHNDEFIGGKGNDYYYDLGGHDTIYGNEGDDVLDGYAGDIIDGGCRKDRLGASYGDDLMTGGSEADTFVFRDGSLGRHEVTDFNPNEGDRISFSDYTVPLDLRFGDDGHGNAMITYATRFGDATVVLDHVETERSAKPSGVVHLRCDLRMVRPRSGRGRHLRTECLISLLGRPLRPMRSSGEARPSGTRSAPPNPFAW